jgi:hypothetical protein
MPTTQRNTQKATPASKKAQTIKMQRGDRFADVHVDEVANYVKGDWKEVK